MITMESVTKKYSKKGNPDPVTALDHVDLKVKKGEFVMVMGPSGSGKSTLLFALGGLLHPSSGKVHLGNTDIYSLSYGDRIGLRRKKIGFVFQTFNLISYISCIENVALPLTLSGESRFICLRRAKKMLIRLGLEDRAGHLPSELSVGERQRVAIGRSLINDPEVLLADEPTGNLDENATAEVMNLFFEFHTAGQTVVMVTHNRGLNRQGIRTIELCKGKINSQN